MIDAIVPVPNRIRPGTLLKGSVDLDYRLVDYPGQYVQISGRDIQSPPLTFYKVFSTWGHNRYEHTFVTDQLIDPVTLRNSVDAYTGVQSNDVALLVPISVKVVNKNQVETFLFTKNIDWLLRYYIMGFPISKLHPLTDYRSVVQDKIVTNPNPFLGVTGSCNYIEKMLSAIQTIGHSQYQPDINAEMMMNYLCPDRPFEFTNAIHEYLWYENNPDALWAHLDDIFTYESGVQFEPMSLLERYHWFSEVDPITVKCIKTPSYIMANELIPYLGERDNLRTYWELANWQACKTQDFNYTELNINGNDIDLVLDVIETLYELPDSDVTIELRRNGSNITDCHNMIPFIDLQATTSALASTLYQAFMNWTNRNYTGDYDYVTVSKTWLGELMIYCHSNIMPPTRYYLNMNMFHLMTPSLVDIQMFNRCQS